MRVNPSRKNGVAVLAAAGRVGGFSARRERNLQRRRHDCAFFESEVILHLHKVPPSRLLTNEELTQFEEEFIQYLVVNGITADDWEKLKLENKESAEKILDLFSDVVFEQILRKVLFLEIRQANYIQAIQCLGEKMIMVALSVSDKSIDLSKDIPTSFEGLDLHTGEKEYASSREKELFELIEKGYEITDGKLFKSLMMSSI